MKGIGWTLRPRIKEKLKKNLQPNDNADKIKRAIKELLKEKQ